MQEVYKKELDLAGKANPPPNPRFPAQRDFRFTNGLAVHRRRSSAVTNHVIKFCKI